MNINLNNKIQNPECFDETGIYVKKNFLNSDDLKNILVSANNIFDSKLDNSALGAQITTFHPNFFAISCPTISINFNMLELAVDVFDEMTSLNKKFSKNEYELTNIDILKDTNNELFWHTDNTLEMYRAFIYLQGGSKDRGAFRQMIGTHKRNYDVNHKLSNELIKEKNLEEKIVVCDYSPGTLIISDINSFHSNTQKKNPRIILIMDFMKKNSKYNKSFIPVKTSDITNKIIQNLELFSCTGANTERNHGIEKRLNSIGNTTKPNLKLIKSILRYYRDKLMFILKRKK